MGNAQSPANLPRPRPGRALALSLAGGVVAVGLAVAGVARAGSGSGVEEEVHTTYVQARYGLSTFKSELAASNDTGGVVSYALGAHVGSDRNVGIELARDQRSQAFALNGASLASSWQDVAITYRWGWVSLGGIMGNVDMSAKGAGGATQFSLIGSGYGGRVGLMIPVERSVIALDVRSVGISQVTEKDQKDVSLGSRLDIDVSAVIDLSRRAWDALVGYSRRSYGVTFAGAAHAELETQTYVGVRWGLDF